MKDTLGALVLVLVFFLVSCYMAWLHSFSWRTRFLQQYQFLFLGFVRTLLLEILYAYVSEWEAHTKTEAKGRP